MTIGLDTLSMSSYSQSRHILHAAVYCVVDVSADCNTVCSGHQDGGLRFWSILTKDRIHFMSKVHKAIVTCVQFDPKHGRYLLSASRDSTISLIDTRTYETILVSEEDLFHGKSFFCNFLIGGFAGVAGSRIYSYF